MKEPTRKWNDECTNSPKSPFIIAALVGLLLSLTLLFLLFVECQKYQGNNYYCPLYSVDQLEKKPICTWEILDTEGLLVFNESRWKTIHYVELEETKVISWNYGQQVVSFDHRLVLGGCRESEFVSLMRQLLAYKKKRFEPLP